MRPSEPIHQPKPPLQFRRATAKDTEMIRWLEEVSMKDYAQAIWGQWRPAAGLDLSTHQMIAWQGKIVGCLAYHIDAAALHLTRLYLAPDARNRGIGAHCLDCVIEHATQKARPIYLQVLRNNPARRFYERHGFKVVDQTATHIHVVRPEPATLKERRHENH